tara:strand:- start:36 stop:491 length:456 start_codon:yes stop_codon:yes gene_type:complete
MFLCKNKKCIWFLKDDIEKLSDKLFYDSNGFGFLRKKFLYYYKDVISNKEITIPNPLERKLFLLDFLNKEQETCLIIIQNEKIEKNLNKILKKKVNHFDKIDVLTYKNYIKYKKHHYFNHKYCIIFNILETEYLDSLKKLNKEHSFIFYFY